MVVETRTAKRLKRMRSVLPKLPTSVIVGCIVPYLHRTEWNLVSRSCREVYYAMHARYLPPWPSNVTLTTLGTAIQDIAISGRTSEDGGGVEGRTSCSSMVGEWLACGGSDGSVRFYHCRKGHSATVFHSRIHPSVTNNIPPRMATRRTTSTTRRNTRAIATTSTLSVHKVHFSPQDPYTMISTANDGTVRLWNLHTHPPTSRLFGEIGEEDDQGLEGGGIIHACRVAFSSDGQTLACAYSLANPDPRTGCHHNISTWSVADGTCLRRWTTNERIYLLAFMSFPSTTTTTTTTTTSQNEEEEEGKEDDEEEVCNNEDRYLLTLHSLRKCRLWDLGSTTPIVPSPLHHPPRNHNPAVASHHDAAAAGGEDSETSSLPSTPVTLQSFDDNNNNNNNEDDPDSTVPPMNEIYSAFSPLTSASSVASALLNTGKSKRYLAMTNQNNHEICLWSLPDGTLEESMELNNAIYSLSFAPNGNILAAGGDLESISLWRILHDGSSNNSQQPVLPLYPVNGFDWGPGTLAFSPNGRILVAGDADKLHFLATR